MSKLGEVHDMAMNGKKVMSHPVYFSGQYVSLPYSYHVVFSAQNADAEQLKNSFEKNILNVSQPLQEKIQ